MAAPRLVYDDDCGFCTYCARIADRYGEFKLVGFSEVTADQRARLPDNWRECFHLLTDDAVYSCGAALDQTLARMHPVLADVIGVLQEVPGYERARDWLYRWGAGHRDLWGRFLSARSA